MLCRTNQCNYFLMSISTQLNEFFRTFCYFIVSHFTNCLSKKFAMLKKIMAMFVVILDQLSLKFN